MLDADGFSPALAAVELLPVEIQQLNKTRWAAFPSGSSRTRAVRVFRIEPDDGVVGFVGRATNHDEYGTRDGLRNSWPRALRRFAAEAWRRAHAGDLADEELYPCDAQWAGLYDRMHTHEGDETARRFQIAADFGERR